MINAKSRIKVNRLCMEKGIRRRVSLQEDVYVVTNVNDQIEKGVRLRAQGARECKVKQWFALSPVP